MVNMKDDTDSRPGLGGRAATIAREDNFYDDIMNRSWTETLKIFYIATTKIFKVNRVNPS